MTKKHIFIIVGIIITIIAAIESGIFDALLIFLMVGALPGTHLAIPPIAMLLLTGAAIIVFTHWVAAKQLYPGSPKVKASQDKVLRRTARKQVRRHTSKRRHNKKTTEATQAAKA